MVSAFITPLLRYATHSSMGVTATLLNSLTRTSMYSGNMSDGHFLTNAPFSLVLTMSWSLVCTPVKWFCPTYR